MDKICIHIYITSKELQICGASIIIILPNCLKHNYNNKILHMAHMIWKLHRFVIP